MNLGEALEKVIIDKKISINKLANEAGYSRQYMYELLKSKDSGITPHKIQLETLKNICTASGYSLKKLLQDIGYIESDNNIIPNTVTFINSDYKKFTYNLIDEHMQTIMQLVKYLNNKNP